MGSCFTVIINRNSLKPTDKTLKFFFLVLLALVLGSQLSAGLGSKTYPLVVRDASLHKEHVLLPKAWLKASKLEEGDQFWLYVSGEEDGFLFTAKEGKEAASIVLGQKSKARRKGLPPWGTEARIEPISSSRGAYVDVPELKESLQGSSKKKGPILLLAPHGGSIEKGTGEIAQRLYDHPFLNQRAMLWKVEGKAPRNNYHRFHITSTDLSESSFFGLKAIDQHKGSFELALSFHGHRGSEILIGGGGDLKMKKVFHHHLQTQFSEHKVVIQKRGERLSGFSKRNIVNRYSPQGIQFEFPYNIRTNSAPELARTLVDALKEMGI